MMAHNTSNARKAWAIQETETSSMKPYALLFATFFCLGILALYLAPQALNRGNVMLFFVLMIAAMILFNRLQGKRS